MKKTKLLLLIIFLCVFARSAYKPDFPHDWFLENILVFVSVPLLLIFHNKVSWSKTAWVLITFFLCFHEIGAHYTYSFVPFGDGLSAIINNISSVVGDWLSGLLGGERNSFDRWVHLFFGVVRVLPLIQSLRVRLPNASNRLLAFIAVNCIVSFGAIFELFEMAAALLTDPELGQAYLGTQGDERDAHKDILLAGIGAIITLFIIGQGWKKKLKK